MTSPKTERADAFQMKFVDLTEVEDLRGLAIGMDVQDGKAAVTVTGVMSGGRMVVLEHLTEDAPAEAVHTWMLHAADIDANLATIKRALGNRPAN